MATNPEREKARQTYDAAYVLHYTDKNLLDALVGYHELIRCYPDTPEARDSRAQVDNIVRQVIPEDVLIDAQVELARGLLERSLGRRH